jgi:hypothetical protein
MMRRLHNKIYQESSAWRTFAACSVLAFDTYSI